MKNKEIIEPIKWDIFHTWEKYGETCPDCGAELVYKVISCLDGGEIFIECPSKSCEYFHTDWI